MRLRQSLVLAAATAAAVSSTACAPVAKGGDLAIGGPASAFEVSSAVAFPNTQHRLTLTVLNVSLDAATGAFEDFETSCELYGTDDSGGHRRPITTLRADGLAVRPANTRDVVFDFQVKTGGFSSHLLFDCVVDPQNRQAELNEANNHYSFLFRAYCQDATDPCPGPVQHGGSVSYAPLEV
jgi:hypothetical protein